MNRNSVASLLVVLAVVTACASESTAPEDASLMRRSSAGSASAGASVVYDNLPSPLPGNYVSLGYEATSTDEFGDGLTLGGTARTLTTVTVGMSSWACESGEWQLGTCSTTPGATFIHPITLNIYKRGPSSSAPTVGALIASRTITATIPYRPSASATCADGRWSNVVGTCFNGFAFTLDFDFASLGVLLDDEIIVAVAYNTNMWGNSPLGAAGPYESLNVGLALESTPATVGSNLTGGGFHDVEVFAPATNSLSWSTFFGAYTPLLRIRAITPVIRVEQCKNDGWRSVHRADASGFANQGDCVSYVQTGK